MDSGSGLLSVSRNADRPLRSKRRVEAKARRLAITPAGAPRSYRHMPRKRKVRVPARTLRTLTLVALLCAGCSRQDTLQPVESIAIGEATLADVLGEDEGETVWLSGQSGPVAVKHASGSAYRVRGRFGPGIRVLGEAAGQLLLLRGDVILGLHPDSTASYRLLEGVETAVLAPAHALLLQSIRKGEIVATPLGDLQPAWGWAGVGAASTTLAVSPEGDRLYQALNGPESDDTPRLLVRDLLTGRILKTIDLDEPLRALGVTAAGELIGVGWDDGRSNAAVSRLSWDGGELHTMWTSGIPEPASAEDIRLATTADGLRIAVVTANEEAGLTLLDGETGFTIANFETTVGDAAFDDRGRLYAVTDSAVLRLE